MHRPELPARVEDSEASDPVKLLALAIVMLFVKDSPRGHVDIDVLFAYTPAVARDAHAVATRALADANRANRASDVDVTFRVAGVIAVASAEGERTIQHLYDDVLSRRDFAEAHAARARAKADVLVLLVDVPLGPRGLAAVMPNAADAIAVVEYHEAIASMTVAHELGHILGARHDIDDDHRDFPFAYGHGFIGQHGRTIMAAPCARPAECPLVPRWSGPPDFGDAMANDARVLRETAATVAAFGDAL
jgi:Metallo-peptidase family M12